MARRKRRNTSPGTKPPAARSVIRGAALALAVLTCACRSPEESAEVGEAESVACPPAGRLILRFIPPGRPLDWRSPNSLAASALASSEVEERLVAERKAGSPHFIGHTLVELDCGASSFPITGQTGGGGEWKSVGDGLGAMLRDFDGTLNEFPEGDHEGTLEDVRLREASGTLSRLVFEINRPMCERLASYYAEYKRRGAYRHFTPAARPRRFEGGGCATFGLSFLEIGGLLGRAEYTPRWARSLLIGTARVSDFLGKGQYPYGSNLLARNASTDHRTLFWPKSKPIPADAFDFIVPLVEGALDRWTGPEDEPVRPWWHEGPAPSAIPITLYDPQLASEWIEGQWPIVGDGQFRLMGLDFRRRVEGKARELTAEASCRTPPTSAFEADSDDLFEAASGPAPVQ